jgi:pyridoxal phosphate enzyme (YggS family)
VNEPLSDVGEALARVRERVSQAAARVGRDPHGIEILAVSKGVGADRIAAAARAGQRVFAENRVQEAEAKVATVADHALEVRWHLVGHLQSNKARRAIELFDRTHSVDSLELAVRLDRLAAESGRRLPVYLQVNVDRDPAKEGFDPGDLRADLGAVLDLAALEPLGLMTVGRQVADPHEARPTFRALADLSDDLRGADARLGDGLSMGMSDDFEVAVEEGATCVRVGRAIFGDRPHV